LFFIYNLLLLQFLTFLTKENRIYIRVEFRQSLGMNFVSPFKPEREFKVYKSCKCSQIIFSRVLYTVCSLDYSLVYFIIWFSFNINFRFSIKWCSRAKRIYSTNMWSTPAVWKQYNKMAVLHFFSSKFLSNIYSILFGFN